MDPLMVVDIDQLLQPIDGNPATGVDLREAGDADYARLKDARRRVVSLARQGRADPSLEAELNQAWQSICDLAPPLLKSRSKDLEVAAWLTEALLRRDGLVGLNTGLRLIDGLLELFWDELHPMPDEDGMESRLYPLIGLNGEDGNGSLVLPIRNAPLSDNSGNPITANLLQRCREAAAIEDPKLRGERFAEIGLSPDEIQQQISQCEPTFYSQLLVSAESARDNLDRLSGRLDQLCGSHDAPPVSALRESLELVTDALRHLYKNRLASAGEPASAEGSAEDVPQLTKSLQAAGDATVAPLPSGPIQSRQQALQQLQQIADFFRQQEPHSPLAGAIERVGRWADLPLQQLLQELIPDQRAREHYAMVTGVNIDPTAAVAQRPQLEPAPAPAPPASETRNSGSGDFSW